MITGIGGGLGRETALKAAARDYRFHGITLSPRAATELNAPGGGLDVLVSNAGSLAPGPLEVLPPHEIRHDVEVDVLGAIAGVNGFMPAPRTTRGRTVHLSAFAAHFPFPAGEGRARRIRCRRLSGMSIAVGSCRSRRLRPGPGRLRTRWGPAKARSRLRWLAELMTAEQHRLCGHRVTYLAADLGSVGPLQGEKWKCRAIRGPADRHLRRGPRSGPCLLGRRR
ncbi:hypothetical protein AB0D91_40285 [Streptomyces canus]|uniref:hypothetical protein n=1 Tax=Streptomyces canus TaxID=58343 RepID=UPI0033DFBC32